MRKFKEVFKNKNWFWIFVIAIFLTSIWYVKNYIITGDPLFPIFAGIFKSFGWTSEQGEIFVKYLGGLKPLKCFKYMNFLFVWPGINPAKYVIITVTLSPLVFLIYMLRNQINRDKILEICFWLGLSVLSVFGICLANWQDPRVYRFAIAIEAFTFVLSLRFILKYCFKISREIILSCIIIVLATPGYKIIFQGGGDDFFKRPTISENIGVITNKIHMDYIIKKHNPYASIILEEVENNKEKIYKSALENEANNPFYSSLVYRPKISLWYSTTIKWDSYSDEKLIVADLKERGIEWIVNVGDGGKLLFIPIEEYARRAIKYDRYPKKVCFDYGFPEELTRIE